jgi:hypothetical protein
MVVVVVVIMMMTMAVNNILGTRSKHHASKAEQENSKLKVEFAKTIKKYETYCNGFDQHVARQRPVNTFQPTRIQQQKNIHC